MGRTTSARLPPEVVDAFDGTLAADRVGLGYVLVTTDDDGRPRPAMLSAGEILATGEQTLRLALWPTSRSAANLAAGRPCVLTYVGPGTVFHVHGVATPLESREAGLACSELRVDRVDADAHPGMPTIQTITYACASMSTQDVLHEWRDSLDQLRHAAPPPPGAPEAVS